MIQPEKLDLDHIVKTAVEAAAFSNGTAAQAHDLREEDWDQFIDTASQKLTSMGITGAPMDRRIICQMLDWHEPEEFYVYLRIS